MSSRADYRNIEVVDVLSVNATDDDLTEENNEVRYRLLKSVKGLAVHPVTGVLSINQSALSKPLPEQLEVAIVAEDSGKPKLSATCAAIVRLGGGSGNAPPEREHRLSVKENVPRGTSLLRLSELDLLEARIVAGNEENVFEVARGKLMLAKGLDREARDR